MKRNIAYMDPKDSAFIIFYLFQVLFRSSCSSINGCFCWDILSAWALKHPTTKKTCANVPNVLHDYSSQPPQRPATHSARSPNPTQLIGDTMDVGINTSRCFMEDDEGNSRRECVGWSDLELWNFKFILSNILEPMMNIHHISQI